MRIRVLTGLSCLLFTAVVCALASDNGFHADRVIVLKKERVLQLLAEGERGRVDTRVLAANSGSRTVEEIYRGVAVTRVARFGAVGTVALSPGFPRRLARSTATSGSARRMPRRTRSIPTRSGIPTPGSGCSSIGASRR